MTWKNWGVLALSFLALSCSKNTLSERDAKREQLRANAETKRAELSKVAGDYRGLFSDPGGMEQYVSLRLEIKDIPAVVEGSVDPVMVPTLKGFLRYTLGPGETAEYIGFPIDKADYNPRDKKLDLVASNDQYKEVIVSALLKDNQLSGTWTAPGSAKSGSLKLLRSEGTTGGTQSELKGTYQGTLKNTNPQANLPERILMSLVTSQDPSTGSGVVISGSFRFYIGDFGSNEYVEYPFSDVQFNFLTRAFTAKVNGEYQITLKGIVKPGNISGTVLADSLGEVGNFTVTKQ